MAIDVWAKAEDTFLMRERLPKGWRKTQDPLAGDIYYDEEGEPYEKDEYGRFVPMSIEECPNPFWELDENGIWR